MMKEKSFLPISPKLFELAKETGKSCQTQFEKIDENAEYNQNKVLSAFRQMGVSESHFAGSTGYGYDDRGRETLDAVFAQIVGAEDALVRHNFVSGTHALTTALFGILRPGDILLSVTGRPYDTLEEVIGLQGEAGIGSLRDFGVQYRQVDLLSNGRLDLDQITKTVKEEKVKVVYLQRSRGYSLRPSLSVSAIGEAAQAVHNIDPDVIVMVDNCYGEFVERFEPTDAGADVIIGSLIKNPGGGIARTGGYIAGKQKAVELCAYRLTSPGMGKEVGCTLDQTRNMFMGLFFAPTVVAGALKTAVFASKLFETLGFQVFPNAAETRADIIQAICLKDERHLTAFCQGIQKGSPVDSFVTPEAWEMPGYQSKVIMAAGTFTLGASIELSADAPIREPFAVWMQGGLTYPSGKSGILLAAQTMLEQGLLTL